MFFEPSFGVENYCEAAVEDYYNYDFDNSKYMLKPMFNRTDDIYDNAIKSDRSYKAFFSKLATSLKHYAKFLHFMCKYSQDNFFKFR